MNKVIFSIGTNIGNKIQNLVLCLKNLQNELFFIEKVSSVYKTVSLLKDNQPDYFNIALIANTFSNIYEVLTKVKNIETKMGRVKTGKWQPRIIDIDIIDFNGEIFKSEELTVPHKSMIERSFVLFPLKEIYPDYVHPEFLKSVDFFIANLNENLHIKKVGGLKWR